MAEKRYTTEFTTEKVNEMLKDEASVYKGPTAEEKSMLDEALKKVLKEYFPEIAKDDKLFEGIKEAKAEAFFLRLCCMQEKMKEGFSYDLSQTDIDKDKIKDSVMHEDKPLKYPDLLTSAKDMLDIFNTVIVEADKKMQDAMASGDDNKILAVYEDPLCQNAIMFSATNEATIEKPSDIENFFKGKANMEILNQICTCSPDIQKMLGNMRAEANMKYAMSGLTTDYKHPSSDDEPTTASQCNQEIANFVDTHPKTVLALVVLTEQRRALGLPVEKIETAEALKTRCDKADVRDVTRHLSYVNRTESLKAATKLAESYANIERTSRGASSHTA